MWTPWGPFWGQWGPIRAKKWVKTVNNYHIPKSESSTTPRSSISAKIWPYAFGAKSRWGPPRVHFGPMGFHRDQKMGQNLKNAPKFQFSITPQSLISAKMGPYGYGAKSRWGPPRVNLVANGVPLGQNMGQNRKKFPCLKIRIFDYPAVIDLGQNWTLRLWRQITVRTP